MQGFGGQSDGWILAQAGVLALISLASRVGGWSRSRPAAIATYLSPRAEMETALQNQEFELYYQPLWGADGRLVALEALVRWTSSSRGAVSPAEFIPEAEENGFIADLGAWVLRQTCRQIRIWQDSGCNPVPVAVNVSARELADPTFALRVLQILASERVGVGQLELEVTETSVMKEPELARRQLRLLHRAGVRVAMDDFGVGYSSLSRLQDLPLDSIKIDRAFVSRVQGCREPILLSHMIEMGHKLGLLVTAEGVETEEQRRRLQQLGCDRMQGFLLARPMPAAAVAALLQRAFPAPVPAPC